TRCLDRSYDAPLRNPTTGIAGCCARAGDAARNAPVARRNVLRPTWAMMPPSQTSPPENLLGTFQPTTMRRGRHYIPRSYNLIKDRSVRAEHCSGMLVPTSSYRADCIAGTG